MRARESSFIPCAIVPLPKFPVSQGPGIVKLSKRMTSPIPGRKSRVGVGRMVGIGVRVGVGGNHRMVGVDVMVGVGVSIIGDGTAVVGRQAERLNKKMIICKSAFVLSFRITCTPVC